MLALATFVVLQSVVLGLVVVAVRRRDLAAAVNATVAFVLAPAPVVVELLAPVVLAREVVLGPTLPVWLAVAGVLHSLGMLGVYESTWWWDHLTHTVSAALVAALLYAGVLVAFPNTAGTGGPSGAVVVATVAFTLAVGGLWELLELVAREVSERFDVEPALVYYGWRDTVLDLGFDVVGALLVVGADLRVFVPLAEQFPGVTVLFGGGWVVVGGVVPVGPVLGLGSVV
jgi:hypothetical protein